MLNKKGWGLVEMLVLSGVILLFLIIATFYIYKAYTNLDNNINKNYYHNLEKKLEEQGKIYLDEYYDENLTSDSVIITRNTLNVYGLDINLMDINGKTCEGYVKAYKTHGETFVEGYVKCPNYITDNY